MGSSYLSLSNYTITPSYHPCNKVIPAKVIHMYNHSAKTNLAVPHTTLPQAEFTDKPLNCLVACALCFTKSESIPPSSSFPFLPFLPSVSRMSAPSVPSKPQHSRHDTALIHGLSTSEVQALSEACIEAKERAYCKLLI